MCRQAGGAAGGSARGRGLERLIKRPVLDDVNIRLRLHVQGLGRHVTPSLATNKYSFAMVRTRSREHGRLLVGLTRDPLPRVGPNVSGESLEGTAHPENELPP